MVDDLVKRLRDRTIMRNYGNGCVRDEADDDCVEAADRIEELEAALREIAGLNIICASDMACIALRKNTERSNG